MTAAHSRRFGATDLLLRQGDITREVVDVIVNAANEGLVGGGGVDGAIHRAGGPAIMAECDAIRARQGGCLTGQAVITTAGRLQARHVVHTVGPVWRGGHSGEPALLASAYRSSLALAAEHGARTIAFPSLSTGVYGYPVDLAVTVALGVARDYALAHPTFAEVRFILFGDHNMAAFAAALDAL